MPPGWVSTEGSFSEEEKVERIKAAAHEMRQKKDELNDLASWSRQADEAAYRYETILGREQTSQPLPDEPVDELSRQLVTAITEALRYTDPQDQADRLIWEVDRIVYDHQESGAPTTRLAGTLMGAIKVSLMSGRPGRNADRKNR